MPVTNIRSRWDSGNLIFHEWDNLAVTGNVLTIAPGIVTIGNENNDVDFKIWMSATAYALFDYGNEQLTLSGIDVALSGDLIITVGQVSLADDLDLEFGTGTDVLMRFSTADDSDHAFVIALDNTSQQMHITDKAAVATDWARTAGTHPEVAIHSNTTPITDYLAIGNHDGTTAHINVVGGTTLSLDIGGTPEYTFTAAGIDMNDNAMTEVGNMTFTDGSIIAAIDGGATSLIFKSGGLTGTTFITLNSVSAGTDNMILGKAFFYDAGGESIESNGSILTITGPTVAFVGAVTGDTTLTVTSTDATTAGVNAIYGYNDAGALWNSGNQVGVRGKVVVSGSSNFVSATGVCAGLEFSTATGAGSGLTCALNAEVSSNNGTRPNSIVFIQSLPGASSDFSDIPYLVFSETRGGGTGTGSRYLFEVGNQQSNTIPTIGTGELFYESTLQIAVNETAGNRTNFFIPLSTAEATFTTDMPIVSSNIAAFDATVTMANTAGNVIRATVTDSGTRTSGDARGLRVSYTIDSGAALTSTAAAIGCGITFTVSDPVPYLYGYKLYCNTITAKAITQIAGYYVYMEDVGNAVQHASAISLNRNISNVGISSDCFLEMRNHGSTAATGFIKVTGSATHLFDFGFGDQVVPVSAGTDSTNCTHKVSVRMADSATRYIHLFTD